MIRRNHSVAKFLNTFGELVLTSVMVLFLANEDSEVLPAWLLNVFFFSFPLEKNNNKKIMLRRQDQCVGLWLYI